MFCFGNSGSLRFNRIYVYLAKSSFLRNSILSLLTAILLVGIAYFSDVHAQAQGRWLEVERVAGNVSVHTRQTQPARVGDRLSQPNHSVTTQRQSSSNLSLDSGMGSVAVSQNTRLAIQRLDVLPDGARVSILEVTRGQARIQARPFTNPNTVLELRTPSGVAAVRGTEFGVAVTDEGKTSIGTLEGEVDVTAESVTVDVDAGFASIIRPGEPPTTPFPLDRTLDINWFTQEKRGNILFVSGRIDPANALLFEDREIPISPIGYFRWHVSSARRNRSISFVVRNPVGESRTHRILLWRLRDLDRGSRGNGNDSGNGKGNSGD